MERATIEDIRAFFSKPETIRNFDKRYVNGNVEPIINNIIATMEYKGKPTVFLGINHGSPDALFGVNVFWEGMGETYAFFKDWLIYERPISICREAKRFMDYCQDDISGLGLRRIQATVDTLFAESIRWHKWLGFETEGILRRYGINGNDYYMMSRIKG